MLRENKSFILTKWKFYETENQLNNIKLIKNIKESKNIIKNDEMKNKIYTDWIKEEGLELIFCYYSFLFKSRYLFWLSKIRSFIKA